MFLVEKKSNQSRIFKVKGYSQIEHVILFQFKLLMTTIKSKLNKFVAKKFNN